MQRNVTSASLWSGEATKLLIDEIDAGKNTRSVAEAISKKYGVKVTPVAIYGQIKRHGYRYGADVVLRLADRFPQATAKEIAEATGRDMAPSFLKAASIECATGGFDCSLVKEMRAALIEM